MNLKIIVSALAAMAVVACGPGPQQKPAIQSPAAAVSAPAAGPEHDSIGVIAAVNGVQVTLDHEGSAAAGLAAGRSSFALYADVAAEAPLEPGTRVAFKFRKTAAGLELTALQAR
ncbi:MAG: hypothetical protein JWP92_581 [Caulobacter sp.]|nr:hypothetical protein [Caulobacter sp.]